MSSFLGMANSKGKRYTSAEKAEVLKWVNDYNAKHGRGGVANASKHFGITQLTIHNWVRQGGGAVSGRSLKINANQADVLRDLANLLDEIAKHETELQELKKKYSELQREL